MFEQFFLIGDIPPIAEKGTYVPFLILVSYVVAFLASFTAIDLADYIFQENNIKRQRMWHMAGAFAMGAGIWSMHFIGMLSYKMDMAVEYNPILTAFSILPAIVVSYFALRIVKTGKYNLRRIFVSALLLGCGIALMHYSGMAAMKMDGDILYDLPLFLLSIFVAIAASAAALIISFKVVDIQKKYKFIYKIFSAAIMGLAICGMHYVGMMATIFIPWADCRYDPHQSFDGLAISVATVTFVILSLSIFLRAYLDKKKDDESHLILGVRVKYIPILLILFMGFCLTIFATHFVRDVEKIQSQKGFVQSVENSTTNFKNRLQMYVQNLHSIKRYYQASDFVGQKEFRIFVYPIFVNFMEFSSVGFIHPDIESNKKLKTYLEYNGAAGIETDILTPEKIEKIYQKTLEGNKKNQRAQFFNIPNHPHLILISLSIIDSSKTNGSVVFAVVDIQKMIDLLSVSKDQDIRIFINLSDDNRSIYIDDINDVSLERTVSFLGKIWTLTYAINNDLLPYNKWRVYAVFLGGVFLAFIVFAYAYTVLKQREKDHVLHKKLEKEKIYLSTIMDNMRQGIVAINTKGEIVAFNKWAEMIFGHKEQDIVGLSITEIIPPEWRDFYMKGLKTYLETGEAYIMQKDVELVGYHKRGYEFPMSLTTIEVEKEKEVTFIGFIRDISEQKEKESKLRHAKKEADQANAAKTDFLANMSHELRTPLNSILGITRMLGDDDNTPEERQEMVSTVLKSSTNLLEIVNDILDISKIESGNLILEQIVFDLKKTGSNLLEIMAPLASEKGISLNVQYEDDEIPYLVGDPFRINRILTNLVGNAIKYTEKGSVTILFQTRFLSPEKICVHCSVKDTGIGISETKLEKIFQKFVQADVSTTRQYGGTGLGLAITKELVEVMDGDIGVNSIESEGSEFWFKIPFLVATDIPKQEKIERRSRNRDDDTNLIPMNQARVLIAEDHLLNQDLIKRLFKRMGFENFDVVDNGDIAVQAYEEGEYDLILMDCHMPDKNGYEATKEIRNSAKENAKTIPIIALTADAMQGTREKCLKAGMTEYLSKPIHPNDLKELLEQWIYFSKVDEKPDEPINLKFLRKHADTKKDMKDFVDAFIVQSDKALKSLKKNVLDDETNKWHDACIKLKSGAEMVGAKKLETLCSQALLSHADDDRYQKIDIIKEEYKVVKTAMKKVVS